MRRSTISRSACCRRSRSRTRWALRKARGRSISNCSAARRTTTTPTSSTTAPCRCCSPISTAASSWSAAGRWGWIRSRPSRPGRKRDCRHPPTALSLRSMKKFPRSRAWSRRFRQDRRSMCLCARGRPRVRLRHARRNRKCARKSTFWKAPACCCSRPLRPAPRRTSPFRRCRAARRPSSSASTIITFSREVTAMPMGSSTASLDCSAELTHRSTMAGILPVPRPAASQSMAASRELRPQQALPSARNSFASPAAKS